MSSSVRTASLSLALLAVALPLSAHGCGSSQGGGGAGATDETGDLSTATGTTAGTATGSGTSSLDATGEDEGDTEPEVAVTLSMYLQAACPWSSRCSGETLESCLGALAEDDFAVFPENLRALGLAERTDCALAATSCSEWEACGPSGDSVLGGFEGDVDGHSCPDDPSMACTPGSDVLVFCLGEEDEQPVLVRDLSLEGLTCVDGRVVDTPQRKCQADACEGSSIVICVDGLAASSDCSFLHPDFACEDFNFGCAVATPECESNSFNNSGGSVQCEDDDTAVACMGGKSFTVSCAAVGGRCENEGELDARCV